MGRGWLAGTLSPSPPRPPARWAPGLHGEGLEPQSRTRWAPSASTSRCHSWDPLTSVGWLPSANLGLAHSTAGILPCRPSLYPWGDLEGPPVGPTARPLRPPGLQEAVLEGSTKGAARAAKRVQGSYGGVPRLCPFPPPPVPHRLSPVPWPPSPSH